MNKLAHVLAASLLGLYLCTACTAPPNSSASLASPGPAALSAGFQPVNVAAVQEHQTSDLGAVKVSTRTTATSAVTVGPQFATINSANEVELNVEVDVWPREAPVKLSIGPSSSEAVELNNVVTNAVKFKVGFNATTYVPSATSLAINNSLVAEKTWTYPLPSGSLVDTTQTTPTVVLVPVEGVDTDKASVEVTVYVYGVAFKFFISEV